MRVLGIETSCDDTGVAIWEDGRGVVQNLVSSQMDLHERFGGVVPELASRAHLVNLLPMIQVGLEREGLRLADLDGVAVTRGPGLIGALLVGLSTAKAICYAAGRPLAAVHHIEGHILANAITAPLVLPACVLVVSGGHTELVLVREVGRYERLGATLDDAAGEAYDKTAMLLGLPFPGGPALDQAAERGRPGRFAFPRPLLKEERLAFSFSGLKTAVRIEVGRLVRPLDPQDVADIAREVRAAITDVLVQRLFQAADEHRVPAVYLAGGVAANRLLRERTAAEAARRGLHFLPPESRYCTDNAAMIAFAGREHLAAGDRSPLDVDSFARGAVASWR